MKQIKHFLLTVAVLLCNISASAHDFEVGGIYYNIMSSADFTAEVTYRGGEYYESNEYSGSVTIPESVTYNGNAYRVSGIGTYAFRDCTGLTSIEIPNSVTSIGNQAFRNCSLLTSVTIPSSVANIGNQTFYQCSELTDVYCYAEKVPSTDSKAFYDSDVEYATLHVPAVSIEDYKSTAPWSGFGKIVPLTEEETGIEDVETIESNVNNAPVYNLQGMKMQDVDNLPAGIYIKNGEKYLVK